MTDEMKLIIREFFKFIFFGMYIAGAVVFVVLITSIDIHALGYIPENSLTERAQEALLAVSVLLLLYRVRKEESNGLYLVVGLLLCMLIREWDAFFDNIFHGAWKFIALPTALFFIYLSLKKGLKAAYVTDDSLAAGLLNGLTDAGISVPADFELISSNDTNYTKVVRPTITSITQPLYDLGAISMRLLTKLMDGDDSNDDEKNVILDHGFVERQSTRK